jgi:hypothetical protein
VFDIFLFLNPIEWLNGVGCPAWWHDATNAPVTGRNKLDDDAGGRLPVRQTSRPGGTTTARVEDAAPQPAGGGVAPRLSVMNAVEPREAQFNERTMNETQAGRPTARRES